MDDATTIGVIELKTCIQAIVQCSPELVAKLGQDYTVYAYDFSEYEQPLVGQGMLSWALAASSPSPESPASESQKLITGRVCKNIQGLFSNGVKETLEVKLRLVPVPTVLQSEYLSSMEKYREVSRYMPAALDQSEWLSFVRTNPNIGQMASRLNSATMFPGSSHEVVNQLLSPSLSHNATDPFNHPSGNENSMDEGRAATIDTRPGGGNTSRPSSRASVKRPRKSRTKSNVGGNTSAYEDATDGDDGPPTKKRAKVVQADWEGRSSFGTGSDSLRVAASTTNSIRTFRPIAIAPANSGVAGSHLQEIPRAPTPVPGRGRKAKSLQRTLSHGNIRRDSVASQGSQSRYQSPYSLEDRPVLTQEQEVRLSIESAMTSPEKNNDSSGETPPDIASSPPVLMRGISTRQSSPQAPSSPVLPQMPRTDSGFMSGNMDDMADLFGEEEEIQLPVNQNTVPVRRNEFSFHEVTPGPMELLPRKQAIFEPAKHRARHSKPRTNSRANSVMSDDLTSLLSLPNPEPRPSFLNQELEASLNQELRNPTPLRATEFALDFSTTAQPSHESGQPTPDSQNPPPPRTGRTASVGSLTMPSFSTNEPTFQPPSTLSRSQTYNGGSHPQSDNAVSQSKSRDAIAKKASIREKLEAAVKKGDAPPFCQNCGAIETPTWRKCFAKTMEGEPEYHEYSDEPGKVIAIEVNERDESGKPTSYTMYKKSLGEVDVRANFEERLLCNPCGIWLSKFKQHRPEDRWYKDAKPRTRGPGSKARKTKKNGQPMPTSEAYFQSDVFQSEAPGQGDQTHYDNIDTNEATAPQPEISQEMTATIHAAQSFNAPMQRQRASSVRPAVSALPTASDTAISALRRAIQSSPARYLGSQNSPIELDDEDLGSTRRTLFPSPRKDASPKVLGELATNVILPITHTTPSRVKAVIETVAADKENLAPNFEGGDPLEKLIEQAMLAEHSRPKTPPPQPVSKVVFKTPTRATPTHRPVTRSVSRSARSQRHDVLPERTPSKTPCSLRRSPRNHNGNFESPFSASLSKLFSEANDAHLHSPSRHLNLGLDFSLPDLGHSTNGHSDTLFAMPNFDPNQDFFSTDVPMPSSPPRLFSLYEDPMSMNFGNGGIGVANMGDLNSDIWNDFQMEMNSGDGVGHGRDLGGLLIDENGRATFDFAAASGMTIIKKEPLEETDLGDTESKKV